MINHNLPQVEIVAEADNGLSTVKLCLKHKPDILLIDLKMPGLNGLDAIKVLRDNSLDVKVIIISAYEYFEYARSALSLDVEGYLVKPISESELIVEIDKVIKLIEQDRNRIDNKLSMFQTVNNLTPMLHGKIIRAIRDNDTNAAELLIKILGRELTPGYVIMGSCRTGTVSNQSFDLFVDDIKAKYAGDCIIGKVFTQLFVILYHGEILDEKLGNIARKLRDSAKSLYNFNLYLAVSEQFCTADEVNERFLQAACAVGQTSDIIYCSEKKSDTAQLKYPIALEYKLIDRMLHGQQEESIKILREIINAISCDAMSSFDFVKLMLCKLHLKIDRLMHEITIEENTEKKPDDDEVLYLRYQYK